MFAGSTRVRGLWTPERISTALWLDAADSSTITLTGGLVSQWDDKSGNTRHATQSSATFRPGYSSGTHLSFDGTNGYLVTSYVLPSTHSVFYVATKGTQTGIGGSILRPVVEASFSSSLMGSYGARRDPDGSMEFAVGSGRVNPLPTWAVNEKALSTALYDGTVLNGGKNGLINSTANLTFPTTDAVVWVGGGGAFIERRFAGNIHEVVIVGSVVSTTTRQKMEGYLAHKWGLTANLPSNHPFKNYPSRGV